MRRSPRHLIGAPKLLSRVNGYKVTRGRGKGLGFLQYTFMCILCGDTTIRRVRKEFDYTEVKPCAKHRDFEYTEVSTSKAYVGILGATQRRLIRECAGRRTSINIVRPKGFVKFVSDTIIRFGYVVDPQNIELYNQDSGFNENNLKFHPSRDNIWGSVRELAIGIKAEFEDGR